MYGSDLLGWNTQNHQFGPLSEWHSFILLICVGGCEGNIWCDPTQPWTLSSTLCRSKVKRSHYRWGRKWRTFSFLSDMRIANQTLISQMFYILLLLVPTTCSFWTSSVSRRIKHFKSWPRSIYMLLWTTVGSGASVWTTYANNITDLLVDYFNIELKTVFAELTLLTSPACSSRTHARPMIMLWRINITPRQTVRIYCVYVHVSEMKIFHKMRVSRETFWDSFQSQQLMLTASRANSSSRCLQGNEAFPAAARPLALAC